MGTREILTITFIVLVLGAVAVGFLVENRNKVEYTTICDEQGLGHTPFKITQYGRSTIWLCADEDGVLRVPKEDL